MFQPYGIDGNDLLVEVSLFPWLGMLSTEKSKLAVPFDVTDMVRPADGLTIPLYGDIWRRCTHEARYSVRPSSSLNQRSTWRALPPPCVSFPYRPLARSAMRQVGWYPLPRG